MSKGSSSSCKVWKDELERLRSRNVQITTSGSAFAGSLTLTSDKCTVRLAPNAPNLLPVSVSVQEITGLTDLSQLSMSEYYAFASGTELGNSR
ncbi:hypothetical protein ACK1LH_05995 [Metabacillus indicus]|uniref:hypothetical protein n=1 Tax=Metabacillus indicus TaxID=246786 RepID=UPI0039841AFF